MIAGKTYRVAYGDETRLVHMAENRENVDGTRCAQSSAASSQRPKSTRQAPLPEEFTKHHHKLGESSIQNPNPGGSVHTPTLPPVVPTEPPFLLRLYAKLHGNEMHYVPCLWCCHWSSRVVSSVCGHSHTRPPAASNCFILSHALRFPPRFQCPLSVAESLLEPSDTPGWTLPFLLGPQPQASFLSCP